MSPLAHPKGKTPSRSCNLRKGVLFSAYGPSAIRQATCRCSKMLHLLRRTAIPLFSSKRYRECQEKSDCKLSVQCLTFWEKAHIIKTIKVVIKLVIWLAKKKTPSRSCYLRKGVFFLVLTAREPSVKPLADVVRCYICCDGQHKSGNTRHFSHLPSRINGRARPQTHYTTRFAKKIQEREREERL